MAVLWLGRVFGFGLGDWLLIVACEFVFVVGTVVMMLLWWCDLWLG